MSCNGCIFVNWNTALVGRPAVLFGLVPCLLSSSLSLDASVVALEAGAET